MTEVVLTYRDETGPREIAVGEGRVTLGRGDVDNRFPDNGLSRHHATVYREGERVWIIDENSTNGSFVNGRKVPPSGTPLTDGDEILIGNETRLRVRIASKKERAAPAVQPASQTVASAPEGSGLHTLIVAGVLAVGLLVIGASVAFIGYRSFGGGSTEVVQDLPPEDDEPAEENTSENRSSRKSPSPSPTGTPAVSDPNSNNLSSGNSIVETRNDGSQVTLPKGRYQDMSDADKDRYIAVKAEKIARVIASKNSEPIPPMAVKTIRTYLTGYVGRINKAKNDNCGSGWGGSDYRSVMQRASKTSPFVIREFRSAGLEPEIGIYIAMVESEHCFCLTSPTGAKGMFQFLRSTWGDYVKESGDSRCDPDTSAKAAAQYMKVLITRIGTAPDSILLAIASFNSGQGYQSRNLEKVLSSAVGQDRSFWTIMSNKDILEGKAGDQFKGENVTYVPKFFAHAIIGENPRDFGIDMQPLSTYVK